MSGTTPHQSGTDRTTEVRTRAFLGLAAGILGALGGGVISNALTWFLLDPMSNLDSFFQTLPQALVAGALGVVAMVLAPGAVASDDPVAAPVARVGQWLGVLAIAGGVLLVLAGLVNRSPW